MAFDRSTVPASQVRLEAGDSAPVFTALDQNGERVSLKEFTGSRVVLYFYPQASTPGCTTQACDFRDSLSALSTAGAKVLGISPDSPEKNRKFHENEHLNFPLVCDEDLSIASAYGVWGEKKNYGKTYTGIIRSTFVLDAEGRIQHALYNVKATGHVARIRKLLGADA